MFASKQDFKKQFKSKMKTMISKPLQEITRQDAYKILTKLMKENINQKLVKTNKKYIEEKTKQVYYFSIEYLPGKLLISNLINLQDFDVCRKGLKDLGFNLRELEAKEPEAGLGNGGLGRLAACFLDSLASMDYAGHGCGIRYNYGLFTQEIVDGHQVELPNLWLNDGYVWEIRRPDKAVEVKLGGEVNVEQNNGELKFCHKNYDKVKAVPYDVPVVGYNSNTVNTLRLWNAEVADDIPLSYKDDEDDRYRFLNYKRSVESIGEFLYPDDSSYEGQILRLKQQYFLCSAGLQSIFKTFEKYNLPYRDLKEKVALHVNDTHPALIIPEMMRILMDEKGLGWDEAREITAGTVSYTNHTLMSEALETWPVDMFKKLLPRIYMIVVEFNDRFCQKLWDKYPGDADKINQMAIINNDQIRMAPLAVVGSHSVNGVAPLHTKILKEKQMNLYYQIFPDKFNNKTNGITHRRWLLKSNRELTDLISNKIGKDWIEKPILLKQLLNYKDGSLKKKFEQIKAEKKRKLTDYIKKETGVEVNKNSIFDIHAKRIHGYKRQLLNILHVMYLYNDLKQNPARDFHPQTFIFTGKAAPGYYFAKRVIQLIHTVGEVINNDPSVNDKLKVVFLPDYSVSLAEKIIPAADVSEQISTASMEASGTGNMKFMMNGALTLGTMDGANIDIHNLVGEDNIFIFGLSSDEVLNYYEKDNYNSEVVYRNDRRIKQVVDQLIRPGVFVDSSNEFENIHASLLQDNDYYFVLKDFGDYVEAQNKVNQVYQNREDWLEKCIINIAYSGKFAADSTIKNYASDIWGIKQVN